MTSDSTNGKKVDLDRFAAIVDAYGADPAAWPTDERSNALALLEVSEDAVRLRDEAAELDGLLGDLPDVAPSMALRSRILEAAPQSARTWSERWARIAQLVWPFGPSWQPVTALAAAAVLGITVGLVVPDLSPTSDETTASDDTTTVVAEVALDTGEYWSEAP